MIVKKKLEKLILEMSKSIGVQTKIDLIPQSSHNLQINLIVAFEKSWILFYKNGMQINL
jgi:hypothetical protein